MKPLPFVCCDSNRTKNKFLALAAQQQKRTGMTEEDFVEQFAPMYRAEAQRAFREVK